MCKHSIKLNIANCIRLKKTYNCKLCGEDVSLNTNTTILKEIIIIPLLLLLAIITGNKNKVFLIFIIFFVYFCINIIANFLILLFMNIKMMKK